MRLFSKAPDGGQRSGVTGYFLIELKSLFSVVLLHFNTGTREAYHSHAFNALTVWLRGSVIEHDISADKKAFSGGMLKYTPRRKFHKVEALTSTWAISFRGPWANRWQELRRGGGLVTLTHGRVEV